MKKLMIEYGTTQSGKRDAIQNAKAEIDETRGIMSKNIESILERGERIDLLVDKTDRLGGSAHEFRVRSRNLRRQMWVFPLLVMLMVY
jgi:vesicle-associated membrane protein 7